MSYINLIFNRDLLFDSKLYDISNYSFYPNLTVVSIEKISENEIKINTSTVLPGQSYTITVSNIEAARGDIIDPHVGGTFTQMSPSRLQVLSAIPQDYNTIRVTFNVSATNNADLTNVANYVFSGPTPLTASLITRISSTIVDIDTNEMLNGGIYEITISTIIDIYGIVIDPTHNTYTFSGIGIAPRVNSATQSDATHIDVVFDEAVEQTSQETAGNYIISGDDTPVVSAAVRQNATTVRLTIPFAITGNYVVTVSNVTDVAGNVVDPAHDTAAFSIALGPELLSAIPEAPTRVTLTFSTAMENNADLINPANYIVTGDTKSIWTRKSPIVSPTTRWVAPMAFDSARGVTVLHAGYNSKSDTWEYDGITWTNVTPVTSPSGRHSHAIAYDSARGVSVIFGGSSGADETWEYNGTTWTQKAIGAVTKPSSRLNHSMAYDSARGVTVLFGGNGADWTKTWEWDGVNWVVGHPGAPVLNPGIRNQPAMAYDSARGVVVLFGGEVGGALSDETWEYDGATWTKVHAGGSPGVGNPSARHRHELVYDSNKGVCVMFGGDTASFAYNNETWEWNGVTWTQKLYGTVPGIRMEHHCAYDSIRHVCVLFAGYNGAGMNDTWERT